MVSKAYSIADLYFFEELRGLVGEEGSARWLAQQRSLKKDRSSRSPPKARVVQTAQFSGEALPCTTQGRDLPRQKSPEPSLPDKDGLKRHCSRGSSSQKANWTVNEGTSELMPGLSRLYNLISTSGSHETMCSQFQTHKKLGLLFTDAAHIVLE